MKTIKTILFGGPGAATAFGDVGLFLLRASFGIFMLAFHGWGKLFPEGGGLGPTQGFVENTGSMGFPMPLLFAWGAVLAETVFALLITLGLFTRLSASVLVFTMGVAAFVVHAGDPWPMGGEGDSKEPAMLYLVTYLLFVFTGAGRYSLDAVLLRRRGGSKARG
ncbi:MAG: DoxX family protein [Phycisphaerae bacterium]